MKVIRILTPEEKNQLRSLNNSRSVESFLARAITEGKNVLDVSRSYERDGSFSTDIFVRNHSSVRNIKFHTDKNGITTEEDYKNNS